MSMKYGQIGPCFSRRLSLSLPLKQLHGAWSASYGRKAGPTPGVNTLKKNARRLPFLHWYGEGSRAQLTHLQGAAEAAAATVKDREGTAPRLRGRPCISTGVSSGMFTNRSQGYFMGLVQIFPVYAPTAFLAAPVGLDQQARRL